MSAAKVGDHDKFTQNADQITEFLWLGNDIAAEDASVLQAHGITDILVPAYIGHDALLHEGQFNYKIWPVMDVPGYPIIHAFPAFCAHLEAVRARNGIAYVHCANGVSRSPTIVVAFLMKANGWGYEEAWDFVKHKRNGINNKKFGD